MTLRSAILAAVTGEAAQETDPYYNLVSLHLKGDVNTGRSYNAFSDASSNNFRLTNNGDVRGSSFSPYNTSWSAYFDGASDYIQYTNSDFSVSTGDFTAEWWMYVTSDKSQVGIMTAASNPNLTIGYGSGSANARQVYVEWGGSGAYIGSMSNYANVWVHICVMRSSGTVYTFQNGTLLSSVSKSAALGSTANMVIGTNSGDIAAQSFPGYLSNVRFSKVAVYSTSGFTPSTSPLTRTSQGATNVQFLTLQSNRFLDSNGVNTPASSPLTITKNGDVTVASFSPFLETDTTSGSGYFDGNGDFLATPTTGQFAATGNFTVSFWFYTLSSNQQAILGNHANTSTTSGNWMVTVENGTFGYYINGGGGSAQIYSAANTFVPGQWYFVSFSRSGNTVTAYLNGATVGSITKTDTFGNASQTVHIGQRPYAGSPVSVVGYIADVRFVDETAIAGTTVPTAPVTAISGTQLLTLQERGAYNTIGFQDESEYQHIITRPSGTNVAQGTFSPFSNSGWSNLFNGSSGYISAPGDAGFAFGTDDFTIEMWVNITGTNAGLICHGPVATAGSWMLEIGGSTFSWQAAMNANLIQVSASSVLGTGWKHVAVTRTSGTTRLFVDGGLLGSSSAASNFNTTTGPLWIGRSYNNAYTAGHISNVRVIKGQALYTGAFTPPANQLTATSVGTTGANVAASLTGTVSLLTCQANRFLDQTGKTITINGSPTVQPFSPFAPPAYDSQVHGGSGYFDRTGDFLSLATNNNFDFGTGNFTVELFYYPLAYDDIQMFFSGTSNYQFGYSASDSRNLYYYGSNSGNVISGTPASSMVLNQWNHIVLVRSGTSLAIMSNGVRQGTATHSSTVNFSGSPVVGGYADNTAFYAIRGYMSGFRAVKGVAVYDPTQTTYTVPTTPLPLVNNTSLLLNFTNAGVIDSTGKNVIETVGNAGVVTTAIKKYGSGSMFFDGTADYLNGFNDSGALFLGTSYTIEFWLRLNSVSGNQNLICLSAANNSNQGINSYTTGTGIAIDDGNTAGTGPSGGTLAINTWYHVALVANGANTKLFIDGTLISTYGGITRYTAGGAWKYITVGVNGSKTSNYLNGYIDDLRITNGLARYIGSGAVGTTYFTAPTKAHPDSGVLSTLTTSMVAPSTVDYLVVGGGGGGGRENFSSGLGGGGGAGGFITGATTVSAATNYVITVGGGGPGLTAAGTSNDGFPSSIVGGTSPSAFTIPGVVAAGGGGGGGGTSPGIAGRAGGSGGGGGTPSPSNGGAASPAGQGNAGGSYSATSPNSGGGGGGAGEAGNTDGQGEGGDGTASSISGSLVTYAGGGGGGASFLTKSGGLGGGGDGGNAPSGPSAQPGGTNTGGGGGGGFNSTPGGTSGAGGSGIVIIAYPSTFKPLKASLGLVYTIDTVTRPGYRVYKFTAGTGSISW